MGWKNIKEHYNIGHNVQVTDEGICIGSGYIHNIIVLSLEGEIKKPERSTSNPDLVRYMKEMEDDLDTLKNLISSPDTFESTNIIYTYHDGEIIEKSCEEYGWPNVTHDGEMMYDNTFSKDKFQVVEWAKSGLESMVDYLDTNIDETKKELGEKMASRYVVKTQLKNLKKQFTI